MIHLPVHTVEMNVLVLQTGCGIDLYVHVYTMPSSTQILDALVSSGSLEVMMVLVSVMCREKKHVHEDSIQSSLGKFAAQ